VEYKGQPLAGFQPFEYPNGYNMFLSKFSLFISNVELIAENKTVRLAEIAFIDLLDGVVTDDEARLGKSIVIRDVPIDQYSSIHYSMGVPSDLNALTPADFENTSALSNAGEYWVGWTSFIFHKTEGKMDIDGNGEFETNIVIHIGSDDAYRESEYDVDVDLSVSDVIQLVIDINDIYESGNTYFDFIETPQIHHLSQLPQALPIMDALSTRVKVK